MTVERLDRGERSPGSEVMYCVSNECAGCKLLLLDADLDTLRPPPTENECVVFLNYHSV